MGACDKCVSFWPHERFPAGSILHHLSHGSWTRCSTWWRCSIVWADTRDVQEHLVQAGLGWAEVPARPPAPTSILLQATLDLAFCVWALWQWLLPASCTVEGGDFFLSLGPFPSSLCVGVAARSPQQRWIPAPWVKAGRLPAEEMLWKWDLLLLCRGTGYFRSRLCWRYGLGRDYCSCWGKCCCIQSFPVSQAIDITQRNHPVHLSLAWPLDSDMWFPQPQRPLLVYSNVRDQAHHLCLPKKIEFPHRFQVTVERKSCQSEGSTQNSSNPGHI